MPSRKLDLENGIVKKKKNEDNDRENVTWMNNAEATIKYMLLKFFTVCFFHLLLFKQDVLMKI